jgi:hypothetical protein
MARGYSQGRSEATPRVNPADSPDAQMSQRSAQYFNGIKGDKVAQVDNFEQTKGKNYDKVKNLRGPELKNAILKEIKKVEKEGLLRTSYPKEIFDGYKIKATTEGRYIPTMNIRAVYPAGHPISVAAEKARNAIDEAFEKGGNKQTPEVTAARKQWGESTEGSAGLTLGNKLKTIVESHRVSNIANDGSDSAGANFSTPYGYVFFTDSTGRTRQLPR